MNALGSEVGDTIASILFDINGVLPARDGVPSMAKLLSLEPEHEAMHAMWPASPSVVAHETGKMEAAALAAGVVADLGLSVTADEFLQEFCSWPQGLLPGALRLLGEIPGNHRVAAPSNTCAVHWDRIHATGFLDRFDETNLSRQFGHLKPAAEAFVIALEGMGLPASDVLLLDDGLLNVEAARSLGMSVHSTRGPDEARSILLRYGVVPSRSGALTRRSNRRRGTAGHALPPACPVQLRRRWAKIS